MGGWRRKRPPTLVPLCFGDDAIFRPRPQHICANRSAAGVPFPDEISHLQAGDPFRAPLFPSTHLSKEAEVMAANNQRQSIVPAPFRAYYDEHHLSPATRVGDLIWVSGQVGIDADMKPAEGMHAQAQIAFACLKLVLEEAGASLADVVELTTFHTDLHGEVDAFVAVKDQYFPSRYPSWTAVGVTQLALPGLVIEIRAVAVAGSGKD